MMAARIAQLEDGRHEFVRTKVRAQSDLRFSVAFYWHLVSLTVRYRYQIEYIYPTDVFQVHFPEHVNCQLFVHVILYFA